MKRSRKSSLFLGLFLTWLLAAFVLSGCGAGKTAPAESSEASLSLIESAESLQEIEQSSETSSVAASFESQAESISTESEEFYYEESSEEDTLESEPGGVKEGEFYFSAEDVAEYLYTYGELPPNYLRKQEAQDLGWVASKGNLWKVTDHGVIGGDRFGNYEGRLPKKKNRKYYECDVNYDGGHRGPERLIYSSDGLIYYTADHYETFTLLYGEE